MWQIREATPADAHGIADVHRRAWEKAYRGLIPDEVIRSVSARRRAWWSGYLNEPRAREHVLVAVEGEDRIVGFASARVSPDDDAGEDQAEVGALYIAPESWRRGIGSALLESLLAVVREDGFRTATLWVLEENSPARRFYETRGWVADGTERVDPDRRTREVRYALNLTAR